MKPYTQHNLRRNLRAEAQHCENGFSLVELLVVVAIIAMLIGLLMSGMSAVRQSTYRNKAATDVSTLASAIKEFRATYGYWPTQKQDASDKTYTTTNELAEIITELTTNPRGIRFIEVPEETIRSGGYFKDSWGRPYVIAMDENNDQKVQISATISNASINQLIANEPIAVMSWGVDPKNAKKRIYSWQLMNAMKRK